MTSPATPTPQPGVISKIAQVFGFGANEKLSTAKALFLKTHKKNQSAEALCTTIQAHREVLDPACKKINALMKQSFTDETATTFNDYQKELNTEVKKAQATYSEVRHYLDALNDFYTDKVKDKEVSQETKAIEQFVANERNALVPFFNMVIQVNHTNTVQHSLHTYRVQLHTLKANVATLETTRDTKVSGIQEATQQAKEAKKTEDLAAITVKVVDLVQKPFDALAKQFANLQRMEEKAPEGLLDYSNRQHRLPANEKEANRINTAIANASVTHKAGFDTLKLEETKAIDTAIKNAQSLFVKHADYLIHAMLGSPTRLFSSYNIYNYVGFKAAKDFVEAEKAPQAKLDTLVKEVTAAAESKKNAEQLKKDVETYKGRFDKLRQETEENFKAQFANFKKEHSVIDDSWFSTREKADLKAMAAVLSGWDKQFNSEFAKLEAKAEATAKAEAKATFETARDAYVKATNALSAKIKADQEKVEEKSAYDKIEVETKRIEGELAEATASFKSKTANAHTSAGNKIITAQERLVNKDIERYAAAMNEGTPAPKNTVVFKSLFESKYERPKREEKKVEKTEK